MCFLLAFWGLLWYNKDIKYRKVLVDLQIQGKSYEDHLYRVSKRWSDDDKIIERNVPCEADIFVTDAELRFRNETDVDNPNRPYLFLSGRCQGINCGLPFGIDTVGLTENNTIPTDFYYEFTDEELSSMVLKGMYRSGFKCPDIFFDNNFTLPVNCDFEILPPQSEEDVPVVFVNVNDSHNMSISAETTGYTLGDYFEEYEEQQFEPLEEIFVDFSDDIGAERTKTKDNSISNAFKDIEGLTGVTDEQTEKLESMYEEVKGLVGSTSYDSKVEAVKGHVQNREKRREDDKVRKLKVSLEKSEAERKEYEAKLEEQKKILETEAIKEAVSVVKPEPEIKKAEPEIAVEDFVVESKEPDAGLDLDYGLQAAIYNNVVDVDNEDGDDDYDDDDYIVIEDSI